MELEADRGYWVSEYLKAKDANDPDAMEACRIMGSIARRRIELHDIAGDY